MTRWLVWWFLVVGGCKSDDVVIDCVQAGCVCGPSNPCPVGLVCDPITMVCEKRGVIPDASVADATHD
jgi:hypothetical protein